MLPSWYTEVTMNSEQLKTFLTIVEVGSFSAAEDICYISKQAMYKQIANLEQETGCVLLERSHTGVRPTNAGKIFFEGAKKLLHEQNELLIKCRQTTGIEFLRIGEVEHQVILNEVIAQFSKTYPEIEIRKVVHPNHSGEWRVASNIADVGESFLIPKEDFHQNNNHAFIPLVEANYYVAMRKGHPLSSKKSLNLRDLTLYFTSMYLPMNPLEYRQEFLSAFSETKNNAELRSDVDKQVEFAFSLLENDHLVIGANPFITSIEEIVTIPLQEKWKRVYGIIYREPMTSTVYKFIKIALKYYNKPPLPKE